MCEQKETRLKDRTMEQDNGFGFRIWRILEVMDVAIWSQAADDFRTWGRINGKALRADGDFTIVSHTDFGLLAPNEGPPRTGGDRAQDGAFLREG